MRAKVMPMKTLPVLLAVLALALLPLDVDARAKAEGVARAPHGKIQRSARERAEFKRANPCPSTGRSSGGCPGYVIDHVVPLKRGGPDKPSNMQWQTKAAAKEKDKWE